MEPVQTLRSHLQFLPDQDQPFAQSILEAPDAGRASAKQTEWIGKMALKALEGDLPPPVSALGSVDGLFAMLDHAADRLKKPAIVFVAGGRTVRIKPHSTDAGRLHVADAEGDWEDRLYYGWIGRDGVFHASRKTQDNPAQAEIVTELVAFSADPAATAARHARLIGRCCFCNKSLRDARSTEAGYGPTCASNFGLGWGNGT